MGLRFVSRENLPRSSVSWLLSDPRAYRYHLAAHCEATPRSHRTSPTAHRLGHSLGHSLTFLDLRSNALGDEGCKALEKALSESVHAGVPPLSIDMEYNGQAA